MQSASGRGHHVGSTGDSSATPAVLSPAVLSPAVLSRRGLLRRGALGGLGVSLFGGRVALAAPSGASGIATEYGPLLPPDANGLMLPAGFTSRVVAVSGQVVAGTGHVWHGDPDGGATFATGDGGWIYVSNAERAGTSGGVGALRFDATGDVVDAYTILGGTARNCAGGPTPWGTWLSCEETDTGRVWECDPFAPGSQGVARPLMGRFRHEAAAVDPVHRVVYLTEDQGDGLLYRFVPASYPDLSAGVLQAAEVLSGGDPFAPRPLAWHVVPDPTVALGTATRFQVPDATPFDGGEGAWHEGGLVHFSTKGDNRVWKIDTSTDEITLVYDLATSGKPELSGVDNVFVSPFGDVLVAEDGGDLQIVAVAPNGDGVPILQLTGVSGSEITGPALSPDGARMYFSSQRNPGVTYEVSGPFLPTAVPSPAQVPALGGLGHALTAAAIAAGGALALRGRGRDAGAPAAGAREGA